MASKTKSDVKVAILKGQEAEDKVLEYVKKMNRPYGAVDVSANLKGTVPKAATQKILVALAERGELVQKTYGKTTFFVANQAKIESLAPESMAALEAEYEAADEENKALSSEIKICSTELSKLKAAPSDLEVDSQIEQIAQTIVKKNAVLEPLRSGATLISAEDLAEVEANWTRWRAEWVRRKKIFNTLWQLATDALTPQDAADLAENLGIETDTEEHNSLEKGSLCSQQKGVNPLKRKR